MSLSQTRLLHLEMRQLYILFLVTAICLNACTRAGSAAEPMQASSPADSGAAVTPSDAPVPAVQKSAAPLDLVIWAPSFFTDRSDAAATLQARFHGFARRHEGIEISIHAKAESGRAGLLAYLEGAHQIAPKILPDIIAVESRDLWRVAEQGLVQPLEEEERTLLNSVDERMLISARYAGDLYGIPYAVDLEHLVYRSDQVQRPPRTWSELLAQEVHYLFAAGSTDGRSSDFLLAQYLAAGGTLNEEGRLDDREALQRVFQFVRQGWDEGIIPPNALSLASSQAVWRLFVGDTVVMAHVPASLYAEHRLELEQIDYGPMPTADGDPIAVARTWSFAIVTTDPERRALAVALLQDLLDPQVHGEWSQAAGRLPTQIAAFAHWDTTDPYHQFLRDLLEHAVVPPNGRTSAETLSALHQALRQLLNNNLSPQEALQELPQP